MKNKPLSLFLAISFLAFLPGSPAQAAWTALGGGDHGGADWTISTNGATIAGSHTNIGKFIIPGGVAVLVQPYNGSAYGSVSIEAQDITINGALSGTGAGYGGGGGGGGGTGGNGPLTHCAREYLHNGEFASGGTGFGGGQRGGDGTKDYEDAQGRSVGGEGGKGGGLYGGTGGDGAASIYLQGPLAGGVGTNGGYAVSAANGDLTLDESIRIGGGGGGGGGGASSYEEVFSSVGGSGGGGAGGSGGAAIRLVAQETLTVGGAVVASGRAGGGNGYNGTDGQYNGLGCDLQGIGGAGASAAWNGTTGSGGGGVAGFLNKALFNSCLGYACTFGESVGRTSSSVSGGIGGAGGTGAGGGILLKGKTVKLTGTAQTLGGSDRTSNGGTLKILYCTTPTITGTTLAGRKVSKYRDDCYIDIGLRVYDGTDVIAVAASKTETSDLQVYWNDKYRNNLNYEIYNIVLVDPAQAAKYPSKVRVQTKTGLKALRICGYLTPATASQYIPACK